MHDILLQINCHLLAEAEYTTALFTDMTSNPGLCLEVVLVILYDRPTKRGLRLIKSISRASIILVVTPEGSYRTPLRTHQDVRPKAKLYLEEIYIFTTAMQFGLTYAMPMYFVDSLHD